MSPFPRTLLRLAALAAVAAACSDNEAPPGEDHTPTSYALQVNNLPLTPPYTFESGQTVRIRIKFFNEAGEDLDEVESSHFGGLTFTPASLATAARLADEHYQFDVTGGIPGSGTVQVSYGHDEQADEVTFDPASAVTTGSGGPPAVSVP
jgi:hypothetical protein